MYDYKSTDPAIWTGRRSDQPEYLHQVVAVCTTDTLPSAATRQRYVFLGYCVDEGVRRNQGRTGAADGPDAIRHALAKLPVHFGTGRTVADAGNLYCRDGQLEAVQQGLAHHVEKILKAGYMPIVLGGGHDVAWGHYTGIRKFLPAEKTIGIINFDAHLDMRDDSHGANSGTPFYQIAGDAGEQFRYLCLGVRSDANTPTLFETAEKFDSAYVLRESFSLKYAGNVRSIIEKFIDKADAVYVTIDLDGFSSAWAPGVSAASPLGFEPDIVLEALEHILYSGKLIGIDIAEMNPVYDRDGQTAKLAAGLLFNVLHGIAGYDDAETVSAVV